jgi:hypothetical protein
VIFAKKRSRWREVDVPAGPLGELFADRWRVHHDVDVVIAGDEMLYPF